MTMGTRTLLVGVHQFILHPLFVAIAWVKLYRRLPRWWEAICIAVHDIGYLGCPNIDGKEGERHPERGAILADKLCYILMRATLHSRASSTERALAAGRLCLGHSKTWAKRTGHSLSDLYPADKLSLVLEPWWLYLPRARLTGELREYRWQGHEYYQRTGRGVPPYASDRDWLAWLKELNCERVLTYRGFPVPAFRAANAPRGAR